MVNLSPEITDNTTAGVGGNNWFGYHGSDQTPITILNVYYAVIPFPTSSAMSCMNLFSQIDVLTKCTSHELCEAITDPVPGQGWYDWDPDPNNPGPYGGYYSYGEIADICMAGCPDHNSWVRVEADYGNKYVIQKIWSRTQGTCTIFPIESGFNPDYSVLDAPAMAVIGDALVVAWTSGLSLNGYAPIWVINNLVNGGLSFSQPVRLQSSSDPNPEYSIDRPAISAGPGNRVYIAWTAGHDPQRHVNVMSSPYIDDWSSALTIKTVLGETSPYGPALAYGNGLLFLAWAGTDTPNHHLNVMSFDGRKWNPKVVIMTQWTVAAPSLFFSYPNLYLFGVRQIIQVRFTSRYPQILAYHFLLLLLFLINQLTSLLL